MPFTEKYKLAAEGLIVDNILKIVKDDLKPCLDVQNPVEALLLSTNAAFLPDLAIRTFGHFIKLGFPFFVADLMSADEEDGEARTDQSIRIQMTMAVNDPDPSNVTRRLAKYVRALRTVLFSAAPSEFFTGVEAGRAMPFTLKLSRRYMPMAHGEKETAVFNWMRAAEFVLTLEFGER